MAKILIEVEHPDLVGSETTLTTAKYLAGATTIGIQNNEGLPASTLIVMGEIGEEKSELSYISISADTLLTLNASYLPNFDHPEATKITSVGYDQIQIYRSTDSGVTYALLATTAIEWDEENTSYTDSTGTTTYYYKTRFYNSITADTSEYSAAFIGTGMEENSLGALVDAVYDELNDPNHVVVSRDKVVDLLYKAEQRWWKRKKKWDALITEESLVTAASTATISLPDYFDKPISLKYNNTTDENEFRLREIPMIEMDEFKEDTGADDDDNLAYFTIDYPNSNIILHPTPESVSLALTLRYYKKPVKMTENSETTLCPMPEALVYWAAAQIERRRKDRDAEAECLRNFEECIAMMRANEKKHTRPRGFKYDPSYGLDYYQN